MASTLLKLLLLPTKVTLPGIGVGLISSMALAKYGRPLLVGTVRAGLGAKEHGMKIVNEAKTKADSVKTEARTTTPATTK